jgi:hypothetical protein
MSFYMHQIPGRLRVKTPFIKGNPERACEAERLLEFIPGIKSVSANTITGSLVIRYDPKTISAESITEALTDARLFNPAKAITNDEYIHAMASKALSFAAAFI